MSCIGIAKVHGARNLDVKSMHRPGRDANDAHERIDLSVKELLATLNRNVAELSDKLDTFNFKLDVIEVTLVVIALLLLIRLFKKALIVK